MEMLDTAGLSTGQMPRFSIGRSRMTRQEVSAATIQRS
jgi:hypothetical protein